MSKRALRERRMREAIETPRPPGNGPSLAGAAHLHDTELAEAITIERDGKHILEVTLIRAGMSRNGNNYLREALSGAIPLFEGSRAFVDHSHQNDLPERSIRDLVGYYKNVRMEEGSDPRLRAELHLVPGQDWLFHLLSAAENNPNLCGLSIDAFGDQDPKTKAVRSLRLVASVDIVTRPAAGGQVDRIIASERGENNDRTVEEPMDSAESRYTTPLTPPVQESTPVSDVTAPTPPAEETQPANTSPPVPVQEARGKDNAPDLAQLIEQMRQERDALRGELSSVRSTLDPSAGRRQPDDPGAELRQLAEQIRHDRDTARADALLTAKLAEAALPEPVARKIRKNFSGKSFEASHLEETIADEKATLAELTTAGQITGNGYEKNISLGMSDYDQLQAAMDGLFDIYESDAAKSLPKLSDIREAFTVCTGADIMHSAGIDRPILESYAPGLRAKVRAGRLTEADAILCEADVTTATFSYLLGTSMNKRLLSDYQAWPSEWQKFTTIVGIKDFKLQNRVRLGAFGSLSTVAEDAAYTTLSLADTQATYTATKRGNLVQITRETIINDDLYAIKQIPQKLAVATAFTLAEFVYNLLAPGFGNIYDAHPLFDSINHLNTGIIAANLGTTNSGAALSSSALQTAVIAMRKQKNLANKPIGLKPRYLLVLPDLEFSAMTILKSAGLPGGNNNDINPMMGYAEPIVSPQLNNLGAGPASVAIWIAVADPRIIDTLEVGFVGGQANPVLLIQDMPLYGLNSTQDTISYKVRHEYGGAVVDYRGFYLGNN